MRKAKTVLKAAASKRRKMKQIEKEKNLITADVPPAKEVPRKNKVQRKDLKEQNDFKDIIKKQLRELNDHNKVQFNKQGKGKRTKARRGSQDNYLDDIKKSLLNMRRQIEDHLYGRTKKGTVQGCLLYTSPSPRDRG